MYPVNLDIKNKLCIVVGGGRVATRKVVSLLDYGAQIRVIGPELSEDLQGLVLGDAIEWVPRGYEIGDLAGAFLVFAATDNADVQKAVVGECQGLGILMNSITAPEDCDFQVPAVIKRGSFQLAVATGGASPAFSRFIRKKLEADYGDEYGEMAIIMGIIRTHVLGLGASADHNKKVFRALASEPMLNAIKQGDGAKMVDLLETHLPQDCNARDIMDEFKQQTGKVALL